MNNALELLSKELLNELLTLLRDQPGGECSEDCFRFVFAACFYVIIRNLLARLLGRVLELVLKLYRVGSYS